jgi:hypothetical protein
VAETVQRAVWRPKHLMANTQPMLTLLKIALAMMLVLVLLPATVLLRAEKRDVVVHTVRGQRGIGPEVVGLEVRLWGRKAFFGVEKKEPL